MASSLTISSPITLLYSQIQSGAVVPRRQVDAASIFGSGQGFAIDKIAASQLLAGSNNETVFSRLHGVDAGLAVKIDRAAGDADSDSKFQIGSIFDVKADGSMVLGASNKDIEIKGNLKIDGTEVVVGATTYQGSNSFGDQAADSNTFKGAFSLVDAGDGSSSFTVNVTGAASLTSNALSINSAALKYASGKLQVDALDAFNSGDTMYIGASAGEVDIAALNKATKVLGSLNVAQGMSADSLALGGATLSGGQKLAVTGDAAIAGAFIVKNGASPAFTVNVAGAGVVATSGALNVGGALTSFGDFVVSNAGTPKFSVAHLSGAVTMASGGTLAVNGASIGAYALAVSGTSNLGGAVTISSGDLSVASGAISASGNLTVGGNAAITGTLSAGASTLASAVVTNSLTAGASTLASAVVSGTLSAGASTLASASVTGALGVGGNTTLSGSLQAGASTLASASVSGALSVGGNTVLSGSLQAGASTLASAVVTNSLTAGASTLASLTVTNNASVGGNASITGTLAAGASTLASLTVTNNASVGGTLSAGASTLASAVVTNSLSAGASTLASLTVTNDASVGGNASITGTLAAGASTLASLTVTNDASVGGNASITGTLSAGASTLASAVVTNSLSAGASTLASLTVTNNASVGGNASITGTLSAGASTLASLTVTNDASVGGNASITGTLSAGASTLASAVVTNSLSAGSLTVIGASSLYSASTSGLLSVNADMEMGSGSYCRTDFSPKDDNQESLGTADHRWKNIYVSSIIGASVAGSQVYQVTNASGVNAIGQGAPIAIAGWDATNSHVKVSPCDVSEGNEGGSRFFGLAQASIDAAAVGNIVTYGPAEVPSAARRVSDVAWAVGDLVYVSDVSGDLTNDPDSLVAGEYIVPVGLVIEAANMAGVAMVFVFGNPAQRTEKA